MFDISFVELMLIGVVALLVLGPEKLPGAARTLGGFIRRARSSWTQVRGEIERELAAEELKRSMQKTAREFDLSKDIGSIVDPLSKPAATPAPPGRDATPPAHD